MTNLRQLVESKGALQSVPKNASENPLKCFSQSPKALHQKHFISLFVRDDFQTWDDILEFFTDEGVKAAGIVRFDSFYKLLR